MRSAVINYNWISHLHSSWDWVISQHRHVLINACISTSMSLSTQHVTVSCSCYCLSFHFTVMLVSHTTVVRIPVGFWNSFWKCSFIDPPVFCFWFQSSWIRCIRLGILWSLFLSFGLEWSVCCVLSSSSPIWYRWCHLCLRHRLLVSDCSGLNVSMFWPRRSAVEAKPFG